MHNTTETRINVAIPVKIHRRAKAAAILRGVSLTDATIDALDKWVGNDPDAARLARRMDFRGVINHTVTQKRKPQRRS